MQETGGGRLHAMVWGARVCVMSGTDFGKSDLHLTLNKTIALPSFSLSLWFTLPPDENSGRFELHFFAVLGVLNVRAHTMHSSSPASVLS